MKLGIIMNGVTGRMGSNQHLVRSILAIRQQGGVQVGDGKVIWPKPVLVGRSGHKLRALADAHGLEHWTTDRAGWQEVPDNEVFENAFKVQWELFLKHVACNAPFPWTLLEGAKGVQLAELGLRSWREPRWLDVPEVR